MPVRNNFAAGEVLAAADLNDTFASKLDLAGGKILQIVRGTSTTDTSTSSTSYVDVSGLSVTITPQKSDSAVLLIANSYLRIENATLNDHIGEAVITDNSNNVISGSFMALGAFNIVFSSGSTGFFYHTTTQLGYATPATTSATTYKFRMRVTSAVATLTAVGSAKTNQLYALEVSA